MTNTDAQAPVQMGPDPTDLPPRVAGLALTGQIVALFAIVLIVGGVVYTFADIALSGFGPEHPLRDEFPAQSMNTLSLWRVATVIVLWFAPDLVGVAMFYVIHRMFAGFRRFGVFTRTATRQLRRVGWCLVAIGPVDTLSGTLSTIVVSLGLPEGHGSISIGLNDTLLYGLGVGLTIVIVSHIHGAAIRLAEENRAFV
ncbi:MAG: DUF2975 domain-containing protein [Paracoccaceae bacterium]